VDKLIIKLFGVNRMNLWGWCAVGLLVIIGAVVLFTVGVLVLLAGDTSKAGVLILLGIGLLLLGHFGVAMQTYCALLAEKLEKQQARLPPLGPEGEVVSVAPLRTEERYRELK
jgi:hypothetical protein